MRLLALLTLASAVFGADTYSGPLPAKPDVPYLLHANKLVETERVEAKPLPVKELMVYTITGAASTARTPMAEPIFIIETNKINAGALELYKLEVKGGNRLISMPNSPKKKNSGPRPIRLSVQKVGEKMYRVEAAETLENGQYSLSPSGEDVAFCFEVY